MNETIVLEHLQDASLVCDMVEQLEAQEGSSISQVHFHKQLPACKISCHSCISGELHINSTYNNLTFQPNKAAGLDYQLISELKADFIHISKSFGTVWIS